MAALEWDKDGTRLFETGVKNGVLYPLTTDDDDEPYYGPGVAWNGLTSVSENPSGAEPTPLWADDMKYLNLFSAEDFAATIEAYNYPAEFAACDGSKELVPGLTLGQQPRKTFGFCYRTAIGNDQDGTDHGYKLHLIYGCKAAPSQKQHQTINDTPEAMTFSWEVSTTPTAVVDDEGNELSKPTACLVIDSTKCDEDKLAELEEQLYGGTNIVPHLPFPGEVAAMLAPDGAEG